MIFFTIVSRNYVAYALTLMQSLAQQHPDSRRYVCLADRGLDDPDLASPLFDWIAIEQLQLPDFDAFVFRYDILELNTAIKPYVFRWLRQQHAGKAVVYLDPDVLVLALKDMQAASLIRRRVLGGFPPATSYALLPAARGFLPHLNDLARH